MQTKWVLLCWAVVLTIVVGAKIQDRHSAILQQYNAAGGVTPDYTNYFEETDAATEDCAEDGADAYADAANFDCDFSDPNAGAITGESVQITHTNAYLLWTNEWAGNNEECFVVDVNLEALGTGSGSQTIFLLQDPNSAAQTFYIKIDYADTPDRFMLCCPGAECCDAAGGAITEGTTYEIGIVMDHDGSGDGQGDATLYVDDAEICTCNGDAATAGNSRGLRYSPGAADSIDWIIDNVRVVTGSSTCPD